MPDCTYTLNGNQLTALLESVESNINQDINGLRKATVTFTGIWPEAVDQAGFIDTHPDFPALLRTTFSVTKQPPNFAKVTINFEGIIITVGEGIIRTYQLNGTTNTEPIETHPRFAEFAGAPNPGAEGPNNKGAVFDKNGAFKGFAVAGPAPTNYYPDVNRDKSGVKSFLSPSVIYAEKRTFNAASIPGPGILEVANLGLIRVPPNSSILPEPGGAFTWILITLSASESGDGLQVDRSWRLSGKNGWDVDIYTPAP